eukprot:1887291-Alexandrium_andersonii.AAC.1
MSVTPAVAQRRCAATARSTASGMFGPAWSSTPCRIGSLALLCGTSTGGRTGRGCLLVCKMGAQVCRAG